jgi:branched-chain amino acid transport system ATP-binding protein
MLELENVHAGYGPTEILHGVSLRVQPGTVVTLVGSNGAGKTTTLGVIAGTVRLRSGAVRFEGRDLRKKRADQRAAFGIAHVPEGRRLFPSLTVRDNLMLGGFSQRRRRPELKRMLAEVYELFPPLERRKNASAGTLSGGEAQLLAVGRALMAHPKLVLLDEPSLGLAPRMISRVFAALRELSERGVAVLLAEQNAMQALALASEGCVLERGRVVLADTADELRTRPDVISRYLGGPTA